MADQQPITVEEHLERVLAAIAPLEVTHQPLLDALGLAAAEPVTAEVSLPGFDNSAMDGYAVLRADVATATEESPVHLPVVGEIGAVSGIDHVSTVDVAAFGGSARVTMTVERTGRGPAMAILNFEGDLRALVARGETTVDGGGAEEEFDASVVGCWTPGWATMVRGYR